MPQVVTSDGALFTSLAKHLSARGARQIDEQFAKILIDFFERALRAGTDSSAVRQAVSRSQDSAAALREAKEDIESEEMKDSFFQNLFAEGGSTARWAIGATALSVVAIAALVMYRKRQDGSRQNPSQAGGVSSFYSEDQHSLPPAAEEQRKRVFAAMQKHRTSDGT